MFFFYFNFSFRLSITNVTKHTSLGTVRLHTEKDTDANIMIFYIEKLLFLHVRQTASFHPTNLSE